MPELPEVETVKKVLSPIVAGRTILDIEVRRKTIIQGDPIYFVNYFKGEKFLSVSRIGKFLIFHLTNDKVLISHLRMEGKYYEFDEGDNDSKYARVIFHLDNNKKLCYDDSRTFGIMIPSTEEDYLKEKEIAKLGPEPFDIKDVTPILKKCKNKNTPIKINLLSQELMTGLGNIYVDEVLYASKIHPLTPSKLITKAQWQEIVKNSVEILNIAIEMGGSTIKSYHPGKDIDGNFQTRIKIYGKQGETCPECRSTYRFIKVGGRGTTFCPKCQLKRGAPLLVAITGKIASGKSSVLETFKEEGIATLSNDEVVKELYQKEEVTKKIEKLLGINFNSNVVNKDVLRNHLLENPKDKKKLEKYVHSLVKEETISFLKKENGDIKVVEVPLLFEAKFDSLFDTIIVVEASKKAQEALLKERNKETAEALKKINSTNSIDQNKNKATYLILNDKDLSNLKNKTKEIINKLRDRLN